MSARLPIAQAKAHLAEVVRRAERGESLVLTRHGRPVARLAPVEPRPAPLAGTHGEIREATGRYEAAPGDAPSPAPISPAARREALTHLLEEVVWPRIPSDQLGVGLAKSEREKILGYGSEGV